MTRERITLGSLEIEVTRKDVKNVHLSVHPPDGRVTLVAPSSTRLDAARAYAASRLGWIRTQQQKLWGQAREPARQYVTRESHYLWGRRFLLEVEEVEAAPRVRAGNRRMVLQVRPGASTEKRAAVMQAWYKAQLRSAVPPLLESWAPKLGVEVRGFYLQRMKTRWGSCNSRFRTIRLNTELAKKPKDLLEYVVVHELAHLREPTHGEGFVRLLDEHYPGWREAREELNRLPLAARDWT